MTIYKFLRTLSILLILIGMAILIPFSYFRLHTQAAIAKSSPMAFQPVQLTLNEDLVSGQPARILIPSLNIDLEVAEGAYNSRTGQWTLSTDKTFYAQLSVKPNNQTGNTLIYGHALPKIFATLKNIQSGTEAYVITDNGLKFIYTFNKSEAFDPIDTSIFSYRGAPKLTLQTCSGSFSQNRQLYTFDYQGYEKLN